PVPNGALLVANGPDRISFDRIALRPAGAWSVLGRMAELLAVELRTRISGAGAMVHTAKRRVGRALSTLKIHRAPVGAIGFDLADAGLAMSRISNRVLTRLDFGAIRRQRVRNFRLLEERLDGRVTRAYRDLAPDVCPLSFPILVQDKHRAARALQSRGVE